MNRTLSIIGALCLLQLACSLFSAGEGIPSLPSALDATKTVISSPSGTVLPTSTSRLHLPVLQDTVTPSPTFTWTPTKTLYASPTPLTYAGSGNGTIEIPQRKDDLYFLRINHKGEGIFKILSNYTSAVFFETTGDYSGSRSINWDLQNAPLITALNIVTEGTWEIVYERVMYAPKFSGLPYAGAGDVVFNPSYTPDWSVRSGNYCTFRLDCTQCAGPIRVIIVDDANFYRIKVNSSGPRVVDFGSEYPFNFFSLAIETQGEWILTQTYPDPYSTPTPWNK